MAILQGVRHYLEELSVLERLKEELADAQANRLPTASAISHIKGMELALAAAFDTIPPGRAPLFRAVHDDALAYVRNAK